jgi:hypothetical protein
MPDPLSPPSRSTAIGLLWLYVVFTAVFLGAVAWAVFRAL